jgi:hypothetical protein
MDIRNLLNKISQLDEATDLKSIPEGKCNECGGMLSECGHDMLEEGEVKRDLHDQAENMTREDFIKSVEHEMEAKDAAEFWDAISGPMDESIPVHKHVDGPFDPNWTSDEEEGETCPECDGAGCPECYGDEHIDRAHDHAQGMQRESSMMEDDDENHKGNPVVNAILRRVLNSPRHNLLHAYGARAVMDAVQDMAQEVGNVDEIGSSDVSGWVEQVTQTLQRRHPQEIGEGEMSSRKGDKGETIRRHTAKAGGYGRKIDKDDESGDKFHSSDIDDKDDEPSAPAVKRGRGRPVKNANSDTGEAPKFDSKVAQSIQSHIVGNLPKNYKSIGKSSHVHKLKEYMQQIESMKNSVRSIKEVAIGGTGAQVANQQPQAGQQPGQPAGTTPQPAKVMAGGKVAGTAPTPQAASQATPIVTRMQNDQKQLAKLGVAQVQESLADTMNKFSAALDTPRKKRQLNESKLSKIELVMEGTLEEILQVYPHEHKMCQEGWGMDEAMFEALCDHYHREGKIPRKVWHGPMEELRNHIEECYMQDTQQIMGEGEIGSKIGSAAGEMLGAEAGPLGSMVGGAIGGAIGDKVGDMVDESDTYYYDLPKDQQDSIAAKEKSAAENWKAPSTTAPAAPAAPAAPSSTGPSAFELGASDTDAAPSAPASPTNSQVWTEGDDLMRELDEELDRILTKENSMYESKKPSAGMSAKEKSAVAKKAQKGGDIGKPGKGFAKVAAKAAKTYGSAEKGKKVAAAAMWKNAAHQKHESVEESQLDELNTSTLKSYLKKSKGDVDKYDQAGNVARHDDLDWERGNKLWQKADNRYHGAKKATGKIVKRALSDIDEAQLNELSPQTLGSYVKKAKGQAIGAANAMGMSSPDSNTYQRSAKTLTKRGAGINKAVDKLTNEQQLDELSKDTLSSYVKKASKDLVPLTRMNKELDTWKKNDDSYEKYAHKDPKKRQPRRVAPFPPLAKKILDKSTIQTKNRTDGISKAVDRLTNEQQLDELSKGTLGSYVKKASKDVEGKAGEKQQYKDMFAGDYPVRGAKKAVAKKQSAIDKRHAGIGKAVDKMTNEATDDDYDQAAIAAGKRGRDARDNPSKAAAAAKRSPAAQAAKGKLEKVRQYGNSVQESEASSLLSADHPTKKSGAKTKARIGQYNRQITKPEIVGGAMAEAKESTAKRDSRAERAGKKVTKDIEWDEKHKIKESDYDSRDAYDKWDPKHPDFAKNYKKYQKSHEGATLKDYIASLKKTVKEAAKPDFLDMDKDGNKKEPFKKAVADKKKKVKETYDFSAWDSQLTQLIEGKKPASINESARSLTKRKQLNEEGLADLFAMLKNAGMQAPQQPEVEVEIASDPEQNTAAYRDGDMGVYDGTGSPAARSQQASGDDPHTKFDDAEDVPVMAMPRGMGMSQNTDGVESQVVQPVMSDEVIDHLQSGESDDSGDDTLAFIKKTMNHGETPVEVVQTQTQTAPQGGGDFEDEVAEDNEPAVAPRATGGSPSPMANKQAKSMDVQEDDVEEGNAFSGAVAKAKADGIQKGEKIKVGGKSYPVKEEGEINPNNGDLAADEKGEAAQDNAAGAFDQAQAQSQPMNEQGDEEGSHEKIGNMLKKIERILAAHKKTKGSDKESKAPKKKVEEDEDNMNMVANRHSELELNEWANTAQNEEKESFITDEDFMIRQISGGLNNQKQDQTLVGSGPSRVVTQTERETVGQSMGALLKKLGGIN